MSEVSHASAPLLCPHCGYDLCQSPGELCSECGHTIDRATLATSNFPWVDRRHQGRLLTLFKTVWLITIDSKHLRYESARTQLPSDGRPFRNYIATVVATTLICTMLMLVIANRGLDFLAAQKPSNLSNAPPRHFTGWWQDLIVPWSTAATMVPTWPLMLVLLSIHLTTAHHLLFRLKTASPVTCESAQTIGFYAIAPLAWLFPLFVLWGPSFYFVHARVFEATWLTILLSLLPLSALLILLLTMLRIIQWNLRVTQRGAEHSLIVAPQLLGMWLLGLILFLGILPWCIGFLWLVIDSFR